MSHIDTIISQARLNPEDWVNIWLQRVNGDLSIIRKELSKHCARNKRWQKQCSRLGYKYFDITKYKFEDYLKEISSYLEFDSK
jgi:hypothetical protein